MGRPHQKPSFLSALGEGWSPGAFATSLCFKIFITLFDALGDKSCVLKQLIHFIPWKIEYPSLIPFYKKDFMMLSLALANKNVLFSNKSDASVGGNVFEKKNL
jgi:hypothetical protein